ncbi:MAG: OadG family transporter subunit [Gammaproteobacteria bacterium]|nr:OadG family transporter subunit [Gammaproteobacteria bacterium]
MDTSNLLNDGFTLMLFGMGFVFIFLTMLVIATTIMSTLITRYERNVGILPEEGVPSPTAVIPHHEHPHSTSESRADDTTVISVISAAVKKFRSRHK